MDIKPDPTFWDRFDLSDAPLFRTAADLARVSVESHRGLIPAHRTEHSHGFLRLTGGGVSGHAADATSVFEAGLAFQKLVTAVASSIEGATKSISEKAKQLTQLQLEASPAPGSLILNLTAQGDLERELRQDAKGTALLDKSEPLVDRSFKTIMELFSTAQDLSRADELEQILRDLGPKSAGALKNLAKSAGANHFNIEMRWAQPLSPALQWTVPASEFRWLNTFVQGRALDAEDVTLSGYLHEVTVREKWKLNSGEFGNVPIDVSKVKGLDRRHFPAGQFVALKATMIVTSAPGGDKRNFIVSSISATDPHAED